MRVPEALTALYDYGVIEDVVRPLMSGKEAQVYLVVSGGELAVAKIYKDAQNRSFKNRAEYTEGRKVRNTRDQRAIANRSKHGKREDEAAWRSTEVDMIRRLHGAGVRVPVPHHFIDGVLVMELITDAAGNPASRLGDLPFDAESARAMYELLLRSVVQMLCAGVVHGDLSEFNVLVGADGPVIIDFPQSIDSAHNTNARKLLLRDVDNLHRFLTRFAPNARRLPYAEEMWSLHERNLLTPETRLRGDFRAQARAVNTASVLELIDDANRDERKRRDALGLRGGPAEPTTRPSHDAPRRDLSAHAGARPGSSGRNDGAPGRFRRPEAGPQGRPGAPKKDAPVYQGLPNEGLKFFRHLRDPQPHESSSSRHGGPRSQGPRPQGSHPQGPRPQAPPNRPQGSHPHGPQHPQGPRPQHPQEPRSQHPQGPRPQQPQGPRPQHPQGPRPQHPQEPRSARPQGRPQPPHDPRAADPRAADPRPRAHGDRARTVEVWSKSPPGARPPERAAHVPPEPPLPRRGEPVGSPSPAPITADDTSAPRRRRIVRSGATTDDRAHKPRPR